MISALLIGKTGNLATKLENELRGVSCHSVGREIFNSWSQSLYIKDFKDYVIKLNPLPNLIINTAGILNPQSPREELQRINFELPKNLLRVATELEIPFVSFGTIMENLDDLAQSNPYLASKWDYFQYLKNEPSQSNFLHLQIHTWYGGNRISPHMFLGQMFEAIRKRHIFRMSSGNQLREYHHLDDDVRVLELLLERGTRGVLQINHGEAYSLRKIAENTFDYFNLSENLQIGEIRNLPNENYTTTFPKVNLPFAHEFRDSLSGITNYFMLQLGKAPIL